MLFGHLSLLFLFSKEIFSYQPTQFFDVFIEYYLLIFFYSESVLLVERFSVVPFLLS